MEHESAKTKWFLRPVMIFVSILVIGPFAIPLVWLSPAFKTWQKAAITAILLLLSVWFLKAGAGIYANLEKDLADLQSVFR
jgi:membrane protein implicated in regulation of membrane protease activity